MSNQNDYAKKLDAIQAISKEEVKTPSIPMPNFLQEGDDLSHWIKGDVKKLQAVGVPKEIITDLPVRVGAAREAQSLWNNEFTSRKEAVQQWRVDSPRAFELRDTLLHTYRYAFRRSPDLLTIVDKIADGNTREDMIQDLNDLAVLGKDNKKLLAAINFDMAEIEKAAQQADTMSALLAEVNGDRASSNSALVIRNKAYTHLKEAMDEIREAGKFVFWKDEERLKGYSSAYNRRKN